MTLMEGMYQIGSPYFIPGPTRNNFPDFLVKMGYKTGAEIGVYKGEFTEKLCKAGLRMYAVDPWLAYPEIQTQDRQDFLFGHASRVLAPYRCKVIRKTSMEALDDFEDNKLDFVYIDADHSYSCALEDIAGWSRKVRPGGLVSGHDYYKSPPERPICQVKDAVDDYVQAAGIDRWWVFGETDPEKEPNRKERFLSWMWIKR